MKEESIKIFKSPRITPLKKKSTKHVINFAQLPSHLSMKLFISVMIVLSVQRKKIICTDIGKNE